MSGSTLRGRVAIVGTGSRAAMFVRGIVARPSSSVVALCEPNTIRAKYYNDLLSELGASTVPVYKPEDFKTMLKEEKVDMIVVTCIDALHHLYIIPALEAGGTSARFSLSIVMLRLLHSTRPYGETNDYEHYQLQSYSGHCEAD